MGTILGVSESTPDASYVSITPCHIVTQTPLSMRVHFAGSTTAWAQTTTLCVDVIDSAERTEETMRCALLCPTLARPLT